MAGEFEHFIKKSHIMRNILDPGNRVIMVMGGSDTGKTTLVEGIAGMLSMKTCIGIVDLDMGQSHIGMPTTIAWGKIKKGFKNWQGIQVEDFYFTGTLSPVGNLVPTVVGAKLITDRAVLSCQRVIVDTTGMIAEPAGRILKQFKIDLLCPDLIIALEHSGELGHILNAFKSLRLPKVHRIPVPPQVESKSIAVRSRFRSERFRSYFTGAPVMEIPLNSVGIRFTREPARLSTVEMKNRIVSLRDKKNNDISLGFIKRIDLKEKKFLIQSPMRRNFKFSTVVIGKEEIAL
jgi:polynucleotide 5'-kinase involved in rRNA processing